MWKKYGGVMAGPDWGNLEAWRVCQLTRHKLMLLMWKKLNAFSQKLHLKLLWWPTCLKSSSKFSTLNLFLNISVDCCGCVCVCVCVQVCMHACAQLWLQECIYNVGLAAWLLLVWIVCNECYCHFLLEVSQYGCMLTLHFCTAHANLLVLEVHALYCG